MSYGCRIAQVNWHQQWQARRETVTKSKTETGKNEEGDEQKIMRHHPRRKKNTGSMQWTEHQRRGHEPPCHSHSPSREYGDANGVVFLLNSKEGWRTKRHSLRKLQFLSVQLLQQQQQQHDTITTAAKTTINEIDSSSISRVHRVSLFVLKRYRYGGSQASHPVSQHPTIHSPSEKNMYVPRCSSYLLRSFVFFLSIPLFRLFSWWFFLWQFQYSDM